MTSPRSRPPWRRVLGVDFSGGADAHKHVWIAEGSWDERGLDVTAVRPAGERFPARGPAAVCAALREYIARLGSAVVGVDAPVGLAEEVAEGRAWPDLIAAVAATPDADAFRARFGAREIHREADRAAKTPFAPTNLRLYRQTYFAIAHLAAPLVAADMARFPPMQTVDLEKPVILETCPASYLKKRSLYGRPYKGGDAAHREARAAMIEHLRSAGLRASKACWGRALHDRKGDGLDALICALIAADAARTQEWRRLEANLRNVEAHIFH